MSVKRKRKVNPWRLKDIAAQIKFCREKGLNVRDDVYALMQIPVITFNYGNKKWFADHKSGLVMRLNDDGVYTVDLKLRAGDIFVWGESNWFCTFCQGLIIDMEPYGGDYKIVQESNWNYSRVKGHTDQNADASLPVSDPVDVPADKARDTESKKDDDEQEQDPELKEYDEDLCECSGVDDFFYSREINGKQRKEWAYLNAPLNVGDVIYGPNDSKDLWIVSKAWILRRTYRDYPSSSIRKDIEIQAGHVFEVGSKLHYAAAYQKSYVLVSRLTDPSSVIRTIKSRNKKERKMEHALRTQKKGVSASQ